jgi:hypothetical protein
MKTKQQQKTKIISVMYSSKGSLDVFREKANFPQILSNSICQEASAED